MKFHVNSTFLAWIMVSSDSSKPFSNLDFLLAMGCRFSVKFCGGYKRSFSAFRSLWTYDKSSIVTQWLSVPVWMKVNRKHRLQTLTYIREEGTNFPWKKLLVSIFRDIWKRDAIYYKTCFINHENFKQLSIIYLKLQKRNPQL